MIAVISNEIIVQQNAGSLDKLRNLVYAKLFLIKLENRGELVNLNIPTSPWVVPECSDPDTFFYILGDEKFRREYQDRLPTNINSLELLSEDDMTLAEAAAEIYETVPPAISFLANRLSADHAYLFLHSPLAWFAYTEYLISLLEAVGASAFLSQVFDFLAPLDAISLCRATYSQGQILIGDLKKNINRLARGASVRSLAIDDECYSVTWLEVPSPLPDYQMEVLGRRLTYQYPLLPMAVCSFPDGSCLVFCHECSPVSADKISRLYAGEVVKNSAYLKSGFYY